MKAEEIKPCGLDVPEPLLRAAEASERRKDDAQRRLAEKLAEHLPPPPPLDEVGMALEALIDANKALVARGK